MLESLYPALLFSADDNIRRNRPKEIRPVTKNQKLFRGNPIDFINFSIKNSESYCCIFNLNDYLFTLTGISLKSAAYNLFVFAV